MASLIVLYTKPDDVAGFEHYYHETHTPIAHTLPNIKDVSVSRITGTPRGTEAPYYIKAELRFASTDEMSAALQGDEGMDVSRDAMAMCKQYGTTAEIMLAEDF